MLFYLINLKSLELLLFIVRSVHVQFDIIYHQSLLFLLRLNLNFFQPAVSVNKTKEDLRFLCASVVTTLYDTGAGCKMLNESSVSQNTFP